MSLLMALDTLARQLGYIGTRKRIFSHPSEDHYGIQLKSKCVETSRPLNYDSLAKKQQKIASYAKKAKGAMARGTFLW